MDTKELLGNPAMLAAVAKVADDQEKRRKASQDNAEKYDFVVKNTCRFDASAGNAEKPTGKFQVDCKCPKCSKVEARYTSDLKQTGGVCKKCRETMAKGKRGEKKQAVDMFLQLKAQGLVDANGKLTEKGIKAGFKI